MKHVKKQISLLLLFLVLIFNTGFSSFPFSFWKKSGPTFVYSCGSASVYTDGAYTVCDYTAGGSDSFQVISGTEDIDVFVVAGGGSGGGGYYGGGGGGGGMCEQTARSMTAGTYTVTVGNGGAAVTGDEVIGLDGQDSVFDTITAVKGGYGGAYLNTVGRPGGPGGSGGGGGSNVPGAGGATTQSNSGGATCYGFAGGNASNNAGGGGGGAGGAGTNATVGAQTAGGIGLARSVTGSSVTYAAGGRGGHSSNSGVNNGTVNTGSGGDAASAGGGTSGSGGRGRVVIRIPN